MRGRGSSGTSGNQHQSTSSVNSPAPSSFASSSQRAAGYSESIHDVRLGKGGASASNQTPDVKMMSALVARVVNKLPCNSGIRVAVLEADPVIQQARRSLVQLSRQRLDIVAQAVVQVLETLLKGTASTQASSSLDVAHSQLFMLELLLSCLTEQWRFERSAEVLPLDESLAGRIFTLINNLHPEVKLESRSLMKLEESVVSFARSLMSSQGSGITASTADEAESGEAPQSLQETERRLVQVQARIIFCISAGTWPLLLSRLRTRIQFLGSQSAVTEDVDLGDLRLMKWANLDRHRLGQVLQELSSVFLHFRKNVQTLVAVLLRETIWNWVDIHTDDFVTLVESNRKLDGGADVLFDVLHSLAESNSSSLSSSANSLRQQAFYPTMAALLVACPDVLKKAVIAEVTGGRISPVLAKKVHFLEMLRKAARSPKMADIVMSCYVDLAKGALSVPEKLDSSGLRSLLPEIRPDIRDACLSVDAATEGPAEDFLTDSLVVLYRSDPVDTLDNIMPRLLSHDSKGHQIAVFRAVQALASEGQRLVWHPPLKALESSLGTALTSTFKNAALSFVGDRQLRKAPSRNSSTAASPRVLDLLSAGLQMLGASFDLVLSVENPVQIMSAASALLVEPCPPALRRLAAASISSILRRREVLGGTDPGKQALAIRLVDEAADHFLVDASHAVLSAFEHGDMEGLRLTIAILRRILLLTSPLMEQPEWSAARESAAALCFIAMFSLLQSPDLEQHAMNVTAMKCMASYSRSRAEYLRKQDLLSASPQTRELLRSNAGRGEALHAFASLPLAAGRQQQQRQLRKVIRAASKPSALQLAMWLGFYRRWLYLTNKIDEGEGQIDDAASGRRGLTLDIMGLNDSEAKEWQNLTATLAAAGQSCNPERPTLQLNDMIFDRDLPRGYDDPTEPGVAIQIYLQRTTDFLVSESVFVRETVKDALGSELPASLYRPVVQQISALLSHAFETTGVVRCSEPLSIFVEQSISMLKLAIDRIGQSGEASFLDVDLGDIILRFARYLHRLGRGSLALRVKVRLCQLCETMFKKKDHIVLSNGNMVRNALLEWLSDWTQEVVSDGDVSLHSDIAILERLQRELDLASLKAIVACSDGLVLTATGAEANEASNTVKSRLFYRHFQVLSRLMNRASSIEDVSPRHTPSLSSKSTTKPSSADARDASLMKELCIAALSNLLGANIDVGLKHSLSMGYHEDESTRIAFLSVLGNILRRGTHFTGLAGKRDSTEKRTFLQILSQPDLNFALAICEICPSSDIEDMSHLMIKTFEQRGLLMHLLKGMIEREVAQTQSESELFRANSLVTRVLSTVARTHGYNYLRASLAPLIQSLCDKPADYGFELDPVKVDSEEEAARNTDHLKAVCQALLDIICSSGPRVPVLFRAIGHHIWVTVGARFPESRHSAVGAFVFLRFFCPAIVAPESVDLDMPPEPQSKDVRRALLMITKVIQNLANNVVFGNKEPFMKALNPFLSENIRQVTKFLSDVAIRPRSAEVAASSAKLSMSASLGSDLDFDEVTLRRFTTKYSDKLEQFLSSPTIGSHEQTNGVQQQAARAKRVTFQQLRAALEAAHSPADHARLGATAREEAYEEFMRLNAGRNVDPVNSVFYEGPMSQNGRRIFYLIVARAELVDYDLLAFHIYQTLDDVTDLFDFVIDLTGFTATTEFPLSWLKQAISLTPPGILPCLDVLVLYNPNTYARKRMRRHLAELSSLGLRGPRSIVAACSPSELAEHVAFTSLSLPESTLSLSYDAESVFLNVQLLSDYEMELPVVLKLSEECLQIASWKKQTLDAQLKSYVIDVIRLEDVDDVLSGHNLATDHLLIKHNRTRSVTLVTRNRDAIGQAIRAAKARARSVPSSERTLRPGDVPGTLLNVALLNMSSADSGLRTAAYDLVAELTGFFQYELNRQVLSAPGLYIASNSCQYIVALSEQLAENAPHLTLEFCKEWAVGFSKADIPQKTVCIQYLVPWLGNLAAFQEAGREDRDVNQDKVREVLRALVSITASERNGLHLVIQRQIWSPMAHLPTGFVDLVVDELLRAAIDCGIGSDRSESVANILLSIRSVSVRGRVIARLRKILAQTYLKPSASLKDIQAWSEICALTHVSMVLAFSPYESASAQLFLSELFHVVTLLIGAGSLAVRVAVHSLIVNTLQCLATSAPPMDLRALQELLVQTSQPEMLRAFGLMQGTAGLVAYPDTHREGCIDTSSLNAVDKITLFLHEVMDTCAASIDLANAWRARWIGLVAATCFQHNPATQPQAFIVLGTLARDEIDDDLVYQILVALSTTLQQFTEANAVLVIAMLRCLARVTPGLPTDSRYGACMFWLAVGVLELSHVPTYTAAAELLAVSLYSLRASGAFEAGLEAGLMEGRSMIGDTSARLDKVAGISFETSLSFSLTALLSRGLRHPASRTAASNALIALLEISAEGLGNTESLGAQRLAYFFALLPVMSNTASDTQALFNKAGLPSSGAGDLPQVSFALLSLPDNSSSVLLVTLITALLNNASSDPERLMLYTFLSEAAEEMPEIVNLALDSLMPRMTAVLATSSNPAILGAVSSIMERFFSTDGGSAQSGVSTHDQVLEDLGMKGLSETTFASPNTERLSIMATWVALLIHSLTA